jgi:hypothetical protein
MPDSLISLLTRPVGIQLAGKASTEEDDGPKWVQIATEGEYKGYNGGEESFTFDEKVFKQVIANLHVHPSFKAGPDGVGIVPIVPWDFEHASTIMPSEGSIPVNGSPARGWTYDFEIRTGPDGRKELWALTEFLEPAKGYVQAGEYQWASVSLVFDAVDPVSGKNIGAVVMSIALTNSPFIEGMQQLAASRKIIESSAARLERWFSKSDTPEDALSQIKDLLGLKETDAWEQVQAEIQKLNTWVTQDAVPVGINMHDIGRHLRNILNLPALMPVSEVLQAAEQSLAAILQETSATEPALSKPRSEGDRGMDDLIKILSELLGTRENQEAVIAEVKDAIALRRRAVEITKCAKDANDDILDAVEDAVKGAAGARDKLKALASALGVEDPDAAVARIADLMNESAKLKELMPELEQLRQKAAEDAEREIESDVDEAMTSRNIGPEFKDALILLRRAEPEKFLNLYPKQPLRPASMRHLMEPVVTRLGANQDPDVSLSGKAKVGIQGSENIIDLAKYDGRNPTARAMSYVRANHEKYGVDPNNREAVWDLAVALKNNRVPGGPSFVDSAIEGR